MRKMCVHGGSEKSVSNLGGPRHLLGVRIMRAVAY